MNFYRSASYRMIYENPLFNIEIYSIYNNPLAGKLNTKMHVSPVYELHYCFNGKGEFVIDGKTYTLTKNTFLLIPANKPHSHFFEEKAFRKLTVCFSLESKDKNGFYAMTEKMSHNIKIRKSNKHLINLVDRINYIMKGKMKDTKTSLLLSAISFIIDTFQSIIETQDVVDSKKYGDKRIDDAVTYVNEHISASLTTAQIANHLNISTKQLTRLFSSYMNISPGEYIKRCKTREIRNYLLTLDFSLSDIADFMGYNDVAALVKFFKKTQGVTPKEFREDIKSKKTIH